VLTAVAKSVNCHAAIYPRNNCVVRSGNDKPSRAVITSTTIGSLTARLIAKSQSDPQGRRPKSPCIPSTRQYRRSPSRKTAVDGAITRAVFGLSKRAVVMDHSDDGNIFIRRGQMPLMAMLNPRLCCSLHALPDFLDSAMPCSLSSGDLLLFGSGLLEEFELCRAEMTLNDHQFAVLAKASFRTMARRCSCGMLE
jgi:hypothetical protein